YRFVNKHFFSDEPGRNYDEIPSEKEVKTAEELYVPVPDDNATFYTLAAQASADLPRGRDESPEQQRERLRDLLRFRSVPATIERIDDAKTIGTQTLERFRVRIGDDWTISVLAVSGE